MRKKITVLIVGLTTCFFGVPSVDARSVDVIEFQGNTYTHEELGKESADADNQIQGWSASDVLSDEDKKACISNFIDCARNDFSDSKDIAVEESIKYFPPTEMDENGNPLTWDNRTDAARHCIWLGLMTERANEDYAREQADAHEKGADGGDGTPAGIMDRHNNEIGIQVGLRHEGDWEGLISECVTLTREADFVPNIQENPELNRDKLVFIRE